MGREDSEEDSSDLDSRSSSPGSALPAAARGAQAAATPLPGLMLRNTPPV